MGPFSKKIQERIKAYEGRINAVAKESVQTVIRVAQTPRGAGGRMRVLTGFLRASINASLNGMPSGQSTNSGDQSYPVGQFVNGDGIAATLLRWKPSSGEPIYIGWTANYARPREYRDGFLRGATEKWQDIVNAEAKKAARRI